MDLKFPFNQDVENAQEKILQAQSAQEIKDLLKQDDPKQPDYQEGLVRLVSQHIMKNIPQEEISRIENLSPSKERYMEIKYLSSKMDNDLTSSIMLGAALKHHPSLSKEPEKDVGLSVAYSVLDYIKSPYLDPNTVEKIFKDVLPKIQQDKNLEHEVKIARKAGYVQGVCECVAAIGDNQDLGKKLLTEMNVNRDMAKKFANPETFKTLEQGIFAPKQEQSLEQTQSFKR